MKPPLVLLLAAATADDDVLLKQLTRALGKPATPKALAETFIDDRFAYLRDNADYTFEAGDANKVVEAFSRRSITPNVPVIDLQSTFENCSALCAFLDVGVPEHVEKCTERRTILERRLQVDDRDICRDASRKRLHHFIGVAGLKSVVRAASQIREAVVDEHVGERLWRRRRAQ